MRLKDRIRNLELKISDLELNLKQIVCNHHEIEIKETSGYVYMDSPYHFYRKRCKVCGKLLERYNSKLEFLRAKLAHTIEQIKKQEAELSELEKDA